MKFTAWLVAAALSIPSFAHAYQYVDCALADTWDRAIITFEDDYQTGTLFMSAGITDEGHDNSGVLRLKFVRERDEFLVFEAENSLSVFTVEFPRALRSQRSDFFHLGIGARLKNEERSVTSDFACFARFYPGQVVGQ